MDDWKGHYLAGQRVCIGEDHPNEKLRGEFGVVNYIHPTSYPLVSVKMDIPMVNGRTRTNNYDPKYLIVVNPPLTR